MLVGDVAEMTGGSHSADAVFGDCGVCCGVAFVHSAGCTASQQQRLPGLQGRTGDACCLSHSPSDVGGPTTVLMAAG